MKSLYARRLRTKLLCLLGSLLMTGFTASAQVNVLTQHNDLDRTGANLHETTLNPGNVEVRHFGQLFKHVVDDQVNSQPLIVTGLEIGGGTHDVVYVTTVNNSVYAFDANDGSAQPFWHVNFGAPSSLSDGNYGCLDMPGNMGIIGTPVIDLDRKALYVRCAHKDVIRFHPATACVGPHHRRGPACKPSRDPSPRLHAAAGKSEARAGIVSGDRLRRIRLAL